MSESSVSSPPVVPLFSSPPRADIPRGAESTAFSRVFHILAVELEVTTNDEALLREFAAVFGGVGGPLVDPRVRFHATVFGSAGPFGQLSVEGDALDDPASFLLGFASTTIPLRRLPGAADDTVRLGLGDDPEPVFTFRGQDCSFRTVPRWRRIVSHFLFLRLLRLRPDLLFFHAASVGIGGKGILLVGPKGSGKSTVSSALAVRGHDFLGDETAAYQPASQCLIPFRRPLGIKPGPRSRVLERALAQLRPAPDEDGLLRVPLEALLPASPAKDVPLHAVCFLDGFAEEPEIVETPAGREELARMQPLASSLREGKASCVFEMIRLLGSVTCYRLKPGDPDATAARLEEVFTRS